MPDTQLQTMREVQKIPAATEVVYGKTVGTGSTIADPNSEQAATPRGDLIQVDVEAALPPGTVKAAATEPQHQQQQQQQRQQQQQDIEPAPINVINEKVKIRRNKAAAARTSDTGGYAEKKPELNKETVEELQNPFRPLDFLEVADVSSLSMCSSIVCDDELIGDFLERYMCQGMMHFAPDW
ncbi:unnamed protein product [Polarella glacialis]|uniref:Uncharacterized protein n=1 Tax=Polarella glacialis TaxID=89957 RepID=A0A813HCT6_POLGL|nr:unnamed protein product [Polarella glacialis]